MQTEAVPAMSDSRGMQLLLISAAYTAAVFTPAVATATELQSDSCCVCHVKGMSSWQHRQLQRACVCVCAFTYSSGSVFHMADTMSSTAHAGYIYQQWQGRPRPVYRVCGWWRGPRRPRGSLQSELRPTRGLSAPSRIPETLKEHNQAIITARKVCVWMCGSQHKAYLHLMSNK